VLSEALWGLAAAGATAIVGAAATDVWRCARLRFGGPACGEESERVESGRCGPGAAVDAGHPTRSRPACVQLNTARDGGTQHITLYGDVNVGRESRGLR
jgi:hypothetical protein